MKGPTADQVRRALPKALRPWITEVQAAAERLECGVLLVGGPVRDLLLGRPLSDVDLAIEPPVGRQKPGAVAIARAIDWEGARLRVHARFGTAQVEEGERRLDLATVRSERYDAPGALPTVLPGTLDSDLRRRDFSVNAMAVPLNAAARRGRGGLIDPLEGRKDLEGGGLRILHTGSFHDDPTRALRAARFAARLGFRLTRGTRGALRDAIRDGAFGAVAGERIRAEFDKSIDEARGGASLATIVAHLGRWDLLGALEPGWRARSEVAAPLRFLSKLLASDAPVLDDDEALEVFVTLWLAVEEPALRRRVLERLALRGELAERAVGFTRDRDRWRRRLGAARGRGATDRVLGGLAVPSLAALAATCPAPLRRRVMRHWSEDRGVALPVRGDDLVALGLRGPAVGVALARLREGWLDGVVQSRDEALALARELARRSR